VKRQQDEGARTSSGTSGGSLRKSCVLMGMVAEYAIQVYNS